MSSFHDLPPIPEQHQLQVSYQNPPVYPMRTHPIPLNPMHVLPPTMQAPFQLPYLAPPRDISIHDAQFSHLGGVFYNPQPHALALFSTQNRKRLSRQLPIPAPPVIIRTDIASDISRKVKSLSLKYPHVVRQLRHQLKGKAIEWEWLCDYFDPIDIWVEGHVFCFHVLDQIANGEIRRKAQAEADERHKLDTENRRKMQAEAEERSRVDTEALAKKFRAERVAEIELYAAELAETHAEALMEPAYINPLAEICRRDPSILDGEENEDDQMVLRYALNNHRCRLIQECKERLLKQAEISRIQEKLREDKIREGKVQAQHMQKAIHKKEQEMISQAQEHAFSLGPSRYVRIAPVLDRYGTHATYVGAQPPSDKARPQSHEELIFTGAQVASGPVSQPPASGQCYQDPLNHHEGRPRGFSNESTSNGRGKGNNRAGNYNYNHNRKTQRSRSTANSKGSPLKPPVPQEPVYIHNDSRSSLAHQCHNPLNRVVSAPFQIMTGHHGLPQYLPGQIGAYGPARLIRDSATTSQAPVYHLQHQPDYSSASGRKTFTTTVDNTKIQNKARFFSGKLGSNEISSKNHAAPISLERTNGAVSLGYATPLDSLPHYGQGGTQTIFYNASLVHASREDQRARTVWVGGVSEEFFQSHKLKDVLSRCGPIEKIAWVPPKFPSKVSGFAFADFVHEDSVGQAIDQLDGFALSSGLHLTVNIAYTEADKRARATSYSSQNCYISSNDSKYAGVRGSEQHPCDQRGPPVSNGLSFEYCQNQGRQNRIASSTHNSAKNSLASGFEISVPQVVPTENSLTEPMRSSVAEVLQKNEAINRLSQHQTPLGPIENIPFTHNFLADPSLQKIQPMRQELTISPENAPNGKENSPIANGKKKGAQTSGSRGKNSSGKWKKNKGSKPNPSTHPTPAPTPTKTRHETETSNSFSLQNDVTKDYEQYQDIKINLDTLVNNRSIPSPSESKSLENLPQQYVAGLKPEWKNKHQSKNKKRIEQSNSRFDMPPPPDRRSIATNETSSDLTDGSSITRAESESRLTSFATMSSRKQSVVSGASDSSSTKKLNTDPEAGSFLPHRRNLSTSNKNEKDAKEALFSNIPTRAKDASRKSTQKQVKAVAKPQSERSQALDSMNDSSISTTSNKSMRKADAKANGKLNQLVALVATPHEDAKASQDSEPHPNSKLTPEKPAPKTQTKVELSNINSKNTNEWPALGPVDCSLYIAADGKRPPPIKPHPIAVPLIENVKKLSRSVPAVVASPSLMSRPPPADDDTKNHTLGSWRWPFVRSSKGL